MTTIDELRECRNMVAVIKAMKSSNPSITLPKKWRDILIKLLDPYILTLYPIQPGETPMSTNDVPGANPVNGDSLHVGCWAEHADGSLIFVEGAEGNSVVFSMFKMKEPLLEYRDRMPDVNFKDLFTWKPGASGTKGVKWTWHDKTPFPWDRIIQKGVTDGPRLPSAHAQMTVAEQIAADLRLQGAELDRRRYEHRGETRRRRPRSAEQILASLEDALDEYRDSRHYGREYDNDRR